MLSETGQRVVYWLGAGASANALPTVGLMPNALYDQAAQLRRILGAENRVVRELNLYEKELRDLADWSIEYGTLDTYARSLYLQGDKDKELAALKMHLSMFFVLAPVTVGAPPHEIVGHEEYQAACDLDPRYMGWLAVLLGDGLRLNPRVKVISWNYDFQVELALSRYCKPGALDQMHDRYNIYPPVRDQEIDGANFFLAHLNGIAGQEKRQSQYHALYKPLAGLFPDWVTGLLKVYFYKHGTPQSRTIGFADRMTFAWEDKPVAEAAISLAEQALGAADILVIIGYSFPPFNRLIDAKLMAAFQSGGTRKRLVVQNPSASAESFRNLFDIDEDQVSISVDTSSEQFHMPNELFKG